MKRLRCSCYSKEKNLKNGQMLHWLSLFSLQIHRQDRHLILKISYCRFLSNFLVNSNISFMCHIWKWRVPILWDFTCSEILFENFFFAFSILHSICCLLTHCNDTTYFCWQYFYFKSNVKNMVITSTLRGLDFLIGGYGGVWWWFFFKI